MSTTKIGTDQLQPASVTNDHLAGSIADAKLATPYVKADGTRALTGDLNAGGHRVTNLPAPGADTDAVRKADLDDAKQGIEFKRSVRVACATPLPANTLDGVVLRANAVGALPLVDDVDVDLGDRVLVPLEAQGEKNGIFVVTTKGGPAEQWVFTRSDDADDADDVSTGIYCYVDEGTENGGKAYVLATTEPIELGATPLEFVLYSIGGAVAGGAGLVRVGNTLNVGAGDGIQVDADSVTVKLDGTTLAKSGAGLKVGPGAVTDTELAASYVKANGTVPLAADLSAGTHKITDLAAPTNPNDAARLADVGAAEYETSAANLTTVNAGDAASLGVVAKVPRSDHQHPVATAAASSVAGTNAEGVSTSLARADHGHAMAAGVVDATALNASVAGAGLTGGGGQPLAVGAADTSVTVGADAVGVNLAAASGLQVSTGLKVKLEAASPTLQIDGSGQLGVKLDAGGGLQTSASGVNTKLDGATLTKGASGLKVSAAGITPTQLATSAVERVKVAPGVLADLPMGRYYSPVTDGGVVVGLADYEGGPFKVVQVAGTRNVKFDCYAVAYTKSGLLVPYLFQELAVGPLPASPAGPNWRLDAIVVYPTGFANGGAPAQMYIQGVAGNPPVEPDVPESYVKLAVVKVRSGAALITTADISDQRRGTGTLPFYDEFTGDASAKSFVLAHRVADSRFAVVRACRNGIRCRYVANPAGPDEYTVLNRVGTAGDTDAQDTSASAVANGTTVRFGSAPENGDLIQVDYLY